MGDEDDEVAYQRQSVDFARPVRYAHGPDSQRHPGVPTSRVEIFALDDSHVYPGISRTVRILVPAQYSDAQPAALMVFQDGQLYLDPDLDMRAGIVIDNLVHRGEMPVTIGVFVDPGQPGHRNAEYDAADDTYATFLLTEGCLGCVRPIGSVTTRSSGPSLVAAVAATALSPSRGTAPTASAAC